MYIANIYANTDHTIPYHKVTLHYISLHCITYYIDVERYAPTVAMGEKQP